MIARAILLVEKISSMACRDRALCRDFSHSYEICSIFCFAYKMIMIIKLVKWSPVCYLLKGGAYSIVEFSPEL
jgi:hypothetical protein